MGQPLKFSFCLIWEPTYKYVRFGGRHLRFQASRYIKQH
jgi:hypothetical protein